MFFSALPGSIRFLLSPLCKFHTLHQSSVLHAPMELSSVVQVLEKIAPTKNAEDWDNVGLLFEPETSDLIQQVFITNDLTEPVLNEALSLGRVGVILSYHPPIFQPFKKLTQASAKERILLRCAQSGIALYSPHTSLDNIEGGINEWLLSGVGEGRVTSIGARRVSTGAGNIVRHQCEGKGVQELDELCKSFPKVKTTGDRELYCNNEDLVNLLPLLKRLAPSNLTINSTTDVALVPSGGRLLKLSQPISLTTAIEKIKSHLKLPHVRVATPTNERPISTVATCAGSGGSVLRGVTADLYLTGEMSHHQVLEATAQGTAVVLCEHSNTERGYLQEVYRERVAQSLPGVEVVCSKTDKDPLCVV